MYCAQCGNEIDDDSRFCRHCGAPQESDDARTPSGAELKRTTSSETPVSADDQKKGLSGGQIAGIIIAIVFVLFVIGSMTTNSASTSAGVEQNADMVADNMDAAADRLDAMADNVAAPAAEQANWSYSTDEDKVRGGTTYYARTTSTNSVHQDPPYDSATTMDIAVRKSPAYGTDVILTISSGQFMCPSYEGCSGTVRFDNGPAQRVSFNGSADDSSDVIFVEGAKSFIAKLKKAKHVVIEKTLYDAGNPQFEFDVSGLKWDH